MQLQLDGHTKIIFASIMFTGNASNWWNMKVMRHSITKTWSNFTQFVRNSYTPFSNVHRVRDKLRNLVQRSSVSAHLTEFRKLFLTIPNMSDGEMLDKLFWTESFCIT